MALTEDQKRSMREGRERAAQLRREQKEREELAAFELAAKLERGEIDPPIDEVRGLFVRDPQGENPPTQAVRETEIVERPAADVYQGLLSPAELARIREEAQKEVNRELSGLSVEKKKEMIAKALEAERFRLRREAGIVDPGDDIVEFLIDLPPYTNRMIINGTVYEHGTWVKKTRREYDSFREIMARGWAAEDMAGNPNRRFYRTVPSTMTPLQLERQNPDGSFAISRSSSVNGRTGEVF